MSSTAENQHTIAAPFAAAAARYRALATEAELQGLIAIRTDAETIHRTEETYRGLIVRRSRYRRHAARLEKGMAR